MSEQAAGPHERLNLVVMAQQANLAEIVLEMDCRVGVLILWVMYNSIVLYAVAVS